MINFLLTEFRRHIIPQTCALIFLQGQIRAGHAQPEDFPLNLWDMERMYEGVYQYLEFFAILTEHEVWKTMFTNWEISNELVTLLKELDAAIPKGQLAPPPITSSVNLNPRPVQHHQAAAEQHANPPQPPPPPHEDASTPPQPVAVERPYDVATGAQATTAPEGYMPSPRPYLDEAQDEPSDFEWRNLKKLAVLVLSSMVWKNRQVQDQVRSLGGIEAILNCCSYDEHNPYIREHAIMGLRFLMEGNQENQERIRALERNYQEGEALAEAAGGEQMIVRAGNAGQQQPRIKVPNEVLDQQGYETYSDSKGQVMLRKREVRVQTPGPPAQHQGQGQTQQSQGQGQGQPQAQGGPGTSSNSNGNAKGKAKLEARDPRDLEQLVQQVMRELPRVQGVRHDAEKAAALAKLDREFDGKG